MKKQLLYSSCFFISSGGYRGEEINGKRIFRRKDSFTFANEEFKKSAQKVLTNEGKAGILTKLSARAGGARLEES